MNNLEKLLQDAGKSAQKIGMTAAEKNAGKAELMRFMEKAIHLPAHAMPKNVRAGFWNSVWKRMNPAYIATPLLVMGLGAGVVYGAENSLPGDFLYPVKTGVIEKFQTSLAQTPKAKAVLHAELAIKRLEEIEQVSKKHELNDEQLEQVASHFDENNQELEDDIKVLKNAREDAAITEIATNFSTKLQMHRPVFDLMKARRALRKQLREELKGQVKDEIKSDESVQPSETSHEVQGTTSVRSPVTAPLIRNRLQEVSQPLFRHQVAPLLRVTSTSTHEAQL